jgi:hypothetical protein
MSLNTASVSLTDGLKTVSQLWDETRLGWDDAVRRDFESAYWEPLREAVESTLKAIDHLAPILARAQKECSE